MFNKISDGPEIAEGHATEVQRRIHITASLAEKTYELQSRVSALCYRFFGCFPVPASTAQNRKEGEGYLYEFDTHLANTADHLKELESMVERLEKL